MTRLIKANRRPCGFSLLELVAVLAILAVLTAAGFATVTTDVLGNHNAPVAARQLALDLIQARRSAIASGNEHFLQLQKTGNNITGYTVYHREGASTAAVDSLRLMPDQIVVSMSPDASATPDFTFEGEAASGYFFTVSGHSNSWQVTVVPATGSVRVSEL